MRSDPQTLRTFVSKWLDKARPRRGRPVDPFDQFIYTYIAFNAMYNAVTYILAGHGPIVTARNFSNGGVKGYRLSEFRTEKDRATIAVIHALRSRPSVFWGGLSNEIALICSCFEDGTLYLHETKDGKPDVEADSELVQRIRAGDRQALFRLIYFVRCNLFHGEKSLDPIQTTLLTNSAEVIDRVCRELLIWIDGHVGDHELSDVTGLFPDSVKTRGFACLR